MAIDRRKRMGILATKEDVFSLAKPVDNSYCVELSSGTVSYLVGLQVEIVSVPFKLKFKEKAHAAQPLVREFVIVKYRSLLFRCFNVFSQIVGEKKTKVFIDKRLSKKNKR
jgi:hypothetical protein